MILNPNKCKILHVSKQDINGDNINIKMGGENLEVVDDFKYLGTLFHKNGKIGQEIKNRIQQANKIYYAINNTILGKNEISRETKLQIYKSVYVPTLLYGSESWPINHRIESQIVASEMKFLRRIVGKTRRDRERNTTVREELKITPITTRVEVKQLKWYGHVKRMSKDRLPRKCMEARMEGSRTRGRPRKTWMDRVEEIGRKRGKNLKEMNGTTSDRKAWRTFVESDPTP